MRDNQLVNLSGRPGHFMGVDLNIEHIIGELKVRGSYSHPSACNKDDYRSFLRLKDWKRPGIA